MQCFPFPACPTITRDRDTKDLSVFRALSIDILPRSQHPTTWSRYRKRQRGVAGPCCTDGANSGSSNACISGFSYAIPVSITSGQTASHPHAPPTPGPFTFNDFINVSPPATTVPRSAISLKSGLGADLCTDMQRK